MALETLWADVVLVWTQRAPCPTTVCLAPMRKTPTREKACRRMGGRLRLSGIHSRCYRGPRVQHSRCKRQGCAIRMPCMMGQSVMIKCGKSLMRGNPRLMQQRASLPLNPLVKTMVKLIQRHRMLNASVTSQQLVTIATIPDKTTMR